MLMLFPDNEKKPIRLLGVPVNLINFFVYLDVIGLLMVLFIDENPAGTFNLKFRLMYLYFNFSPPFITVAQYSAQINNVVYIDQFTT